MAYIDHIRIDLGFVTQKYKDAVFIFNDDPLTQCYEVKIEYKNTWKKILVSHELIYDKPFAWEEIIDAIFSQWDFLSSDYNICQMPPKTDFDDRVEYWKKFFG